MVVAFFAWTCEISCTGRFRCIKKETRLLAQFSTLISYSSFLAGKSSPKFLREQYFDSKQETLIKTFFVFWCLLKSSRFHIKENVTRHVNFSENWCKTWSDRNEVKQSGWLLLDFHILDTKPKNNRSNHPILPDMLHK